MGKFNSGGTVQVAKTAPATTYENEDVKTANENTRRRLAANSRNASNLYWTSLLGAGTQKPAAGGRKTTLG